jgi:mRNA interferase RelE/StbE
MYNIEFSKTSEKELYKLERQVQLRIISNLERIRVRPYHFVKRLVESPYFRLRVGDYRVILDIEDDRLLVLVIEIGHRSAIYKK